MSRRKVILKVPDVDPKYLCSSCRLLLDDPRQAECGHRYCRSCVEELTGSVGGRCKIPGCNENITLQKVFPDKAIEKETQSFPVVCNNDDDGCKWEGFLKQLNVHLDECGYEKIACIHKDCWEKFPRRDLSKHLADNCAFRSAVCQWCKETHPSKDIAKHQESCPMAPARCDWCGKKGLTRSQLQDHQHPQSGDCPNMKQPCHFEPLEKKQHGDHQKKTLTAHLSMVLGMLHHLATNVEGVRDQSEESRENMRAVIHRLDKSIKDQGSKIAQLEQKVSEYQSEGATASGSGNLKALEIKILNREIEKCSSRMEAYERQRRQDIERFETLESKIRSLERIIAVKDALAEQDLRIQKKESTSYDGVLTWKIADFTRKRHDAITGKTASFYSPCFFTSRTGYKMCARIYLNGDGMGKGTHVSLFFVVMRGHYDGLLRWPFRQKVTFMLLDQNNNEHVIDAFRPDPTSSSFQRPTSDMNIASGCPLFVPLSQLDSSSHAYVRDDTMYLRVIVDTCDLN